MKPSIARLKDLSGRRRSFAVLRMDKGAQDDKIE
jgi:hypothetical protein